MRYAVSPDFGECMIKIARRGKMQESIKKFMRALRQIRCRKIGLRLECRADLIEANTEIATIEENLSTLLLQLSQARKVIGSIAIVNSGPNLEIASLLTVLERRYTTCICIQGSYVSSAAFLEIFNSANYPRLVKLELVDNQLDLSNVRGLQAADFNYLNWLKIEMNPIGDRGAKVLCKANMPKLRNLTLMQINASAKIFSYLQKMSVCKEQTVLSLSISNLTSQTENLISSLSFYHVELIEEDETYDK